ncbi:MAG TPA: hypothetical protein VFZ00_23450 [Solirubrobacter sp.]|nr:hypothetical protein [Solirubrobacter sp.]
MEVVLPNGELLRTGMGAMPENRSWHLSKRGLGPQPEVYPIGWVTVDDDEHLPELLEAVRPLMIDRAIPNFPSIFTASGALAVGGDTDGAAALAALLERVAAPTALRDIGLADEQLDEAVGLLLDAATCPTAHDRPTRPRWWRSCAAPSRAVRSRTPPDRRGP